jgi:hypothetical protein
MTTEKYEKLPPEEKEHSAKCQNVTKSLIAEAWTKFCSITPTMSTGRTFNIQAQKSCNVS